MVLLYFRLEIINLAPSVYETYILEGDSYGTLSMPMSKFQPRVRKGPDASTLDQGHLVGSGHLPMTTEPAYAAFRHYRLYFKNY